MMAIVFAVVSSFNSVGVSVYQEQLFKVKENKRENFVGNINIESYFLILESILFPKTYNRYLCMMNHKICSVVTSSLNNFLIVFSFRTFIVDT